MYINTSKVLQEQVWTAAHELGHVWKVDQYVQDNVANCNIDIRSILKEHTRE